MPTIIDPSDTEKLQLIDELDKAEQVQKEMSARIINLRYELRRIEEAEFLEELAALCNKHSMSIQASGETLYAQWHEKGKRTHTAANVLDNWETL